MIIRNTRFRNVMSAIRFTGKDQLSRTLQDISNYTSAEMPQKKKRKKKSLKNPKSNPKKSKKKRKSIYKWKMCQNRNCVWKKKILQIEFLKLIEN